MSDACATSSTAATSLVAKLCWPRADPQPRNKETLMPKIRFATTDDAADVVASLEPDCQEAVRVAYNEVCTSLTSFSNFSPESDGKTAKIVELTVETTKLGVKGRACLGWLLEGSGFRVTMEHDKVQTKRPIEAGGEPEQYEAVLTTVVLGW
jgi:hypothetical protein